jgi:hypothetical protein
MGWHMALRGEEQAEIPAPSGPTLGGSGGRLKLSVARRNRADPIGLWLALMHDAIVDVWKGCCRRQVS